MAAPDDATLERLADVLARVGSDADTVPTAALVELGALAGDGALTVDYRARAVLGHPLIVWRPGVERPAWWDALTPREREVAELVADGLSNAAVAKRLGLGLGTVKDHVHAVLTKARFRRRSQIAAALATR
jgi:DNA-binding NarL/FixJ family response regulator